MLPENITTARTVAEEAANTSNAYASYEPTVSDVLKQKAMEAYGNNQDIVKPLDVATQNYLEAPQVGREQYQDIFNPFTREKLVSQFIGTKSLPMLSLSSILGNRYGRIEDIMGAGTRAFQAQSAAQLAGATEKRQTYTDLLNEYLQTEQLRQRERELDISASKGTGSMSFTDALAALQALMNPGGNDQGQNLESPPMSSSYGRTDIEYEYPQGSGVIWTSDGKGGWI
jgi:hypothetical protein